MVFLLFFPTPTWFPLGRRSLSAVGCGVKYGGAKGRLRRGVQISRKDIKQLGDIHKTSGYFIFVYMAYGLYWITNNGLFNQQKY